MNIKDTTPVDIARLASTFRIYLRDNLYPNNQAAIQDSICSSIPNTLDISQIGNAEYSVKCSCRKNTNNEYNMNVEDAIINILGTIYPQYILTDNNIDNKTRVEFNIIYHNIMTFLHMSWYLKMLYNIYYFQTNTTSRIIMVTL